MRTEVIDRNLELAVNMLSQQTGKVPGGPTGCCFSVGMVALTGRYVPFPVPSEHDQLQLAKKLGVVDYGVIPLRNQSPLELLPLVLTQNVFSFDAVVLRGSVEGFRHRVTVIPASDSDAYHVIDSLAPGARVIYTDVDQVTTYIDDRFDDDLPIRLGVTASEEEQRKGTLNSTHRLPLSEDIEIQIVPVP